MSNNDNKRALLAHKEKILDDIKYYEQRIENFGVLENTTYYEDSDSSDSEDDFPINIDAGPSMVQLKLQQSMLRTCLQATQELTNLLVLQSEVNVMVEDPVLDRELSVNEQGTWREVTAECRVDLIPFSITFHVHQPGRVFGPTSYRGLRVVPVKSAHEAELAKSVLPGVTRPSDAVEVLRSYAAAYRSRRTTLAELVDRFANTLFMEAIAGGGYILKCANLLEVSWRLENRWSPVAPFHHRMKFDIEYMDETYIRTITEAHTQLSVPSVDTSERTRLLSRIITTCLEAQGPTRELYESMESDPESVKRLEKRRTTLDERPEAASRNKDSEVMAPPKSLPKKSKPKGKENTNDNRKADGKALKRVNTDNNEGVMKKTKINNEQNEVVSVRLGNKEVNTEMCTKNCVTNSDGEVKNPEGTGKGGNVAAAKNNLPNSGKKVENSVSVTNKLQEQNKHRKTIQTVVSVEMNNIQKTSNISSFNNAEKCVKTSKKSSVESNKNQMNANLNTDIQLSKKDSIASTKKNVASVNKAADIGRKFKNVAVVKKSQMETGSAEKKSVNEAIGGKAKSIASSKNSLPGSGKKVESTGNKHKTTNKSLNTKSPPDSGKNNVKNINPTKDVQAKAIIVKNVNDSKKNSATKGTSQEKHLKLINKKIITKQSAGSNPLNGNTVEVSKVKSVATLKSKNNLAEIAAKNTNVAKTNVNIPDEEIQTEKIGDKTKKAGDIRNKIVIKNLNHKNQSAKNKLKQTQSKPKISPGNTGKKLQGGNTEKQISKIPQKKFSPVSEGVLKKNPHRISPRKFPSKFKTPSESNNQKTAQKLGTNIPRLLRKPTPKTMQA